MTAPLPALPLLFSVGEEYSVLEVVGLSFVPALLFVIYVLWSDRRSRAS